MIQVTPNRNPQIELDGQWFDYYATRMRIARMNNNHYRREKTAMQRQYAERLLKSDPTDVDEFGNDLEMRLGCKLVARTLLKDWEGIEEDGEPVPYTEELGYEVLRRDTDLRDFIDLKARAKNWAEAQEAEVTLGE